MMELWLKLLQQQGSTVAADDVARLLESDLELNSQGLLIWFAAPAQKQLLRQGGAVMESFKAFRIHEESKKIVARFEQLKLDDLSPGDVVVRVTHSDINYKDALAATGAGKILRRYPACRRNRFRGRRRILQLIRAIQAGDPVLVTGSRCQRRMMGVMPNSPA